MAWSGLEWSCWLLVDISHLAVLGVAAHGCQFLSTPFQKKYSDTIHLVAYMPGWVRLWMAWKAAALSATGTSSLVMAYATSQSRLASSTGTVLTVREKDLVACSMQGQLAWLAAILVSYACSWLKINHASCHIKKVNVERRFACLP
jgi:hypothetical protein